MNNGRMLAVVRVALPDGSERSVSVTESTWNIGRTEDNDLALSHRLVSRRHARLLFEGERVLLVDLGSTNGTSVGESRLSPNQPHALSYGEVFRIGPYTLRLEPAPVQADAVDGEPGDREPVGVEPEVSLEPEPEAEPLPEQEPEAGPPSPEAAVFSDLARSPPAVLPPEEPPIAPTVNGHRPYDEAFGLSLERSRYLDLLPPIYHADPFLGRFLLAFEGTLLPIEQVVDNFDFFLDARTAPSFFLEQLAAWLGLSLDEKWPLAKRRALITEMAELYRRRGTRWSLSRYLEIYADVVPEIIEPEERPHHFEVVLRVPRDRRIDRSIVDRIIRANKPAHTTYSFEILREDG